MATFEAYRDRFGQDLGNYLRSTATSGSTVSVVEDTTFPIQSSMSIHDLYQDYYLLLPDNATADQVRRISSYDPVNAKLTLDKALTTAPSSGDQYELWGLVEPWDELLDIFNQALKRMLIVVEFNFTPTADQHRHNLTTQKSWITEEWQVIIAGWLKTTDDRDEVDPFRYRTVRGDTYKDLASIYLDHPGKTFSASTDKIYVRAYSRAYDQCRASGGTFGDRAGLAAETHEAIPDEEWLSAVAMVVMWQRYAHLLQPRADAGLIASRREAAAIVTDMQRNRLRPYARMLRPISHFGPLSRAGSGRRRR